MDLDALASARHDDWQRLDALARDGRLDGRGADELIERYQGAASDLSLMQATVGSTALGDRLSVGLARARLRFTGTPENPLRSFTRFAVVDLPAALFRVRWLTLVIAAVTVLVAGLYAWWIGSDPRVLANLGDEAELRQLADEGFVAYYSENPAASFAGAVWTNNAWIAAQCVAFGITGLWVPYVILQNAQNLGITAAIMFAYDEADTFFLYITPHGLLELTCVFVAGGVGLRLFWSWIEPGGLTRTASVARAGRTAITVALGLGVVLLISGIVEAFVTPSPLPTWARVGIGVLAEAVFLAYVFVVGRAAARRGATGDISARLLEDRVATSA
jgi:uncharacterized membrane protein SpoIIM required for sporulation